MSEDNSGSRSEWILCSAAISWIVLSPRSASGATFALKSPLNHLRVLIAYPSVGRWNTPLQPVQFPGTTSVRQKTAWHLAMRIRQAFEDEGVAIAGPFEVDETYMGGKEKNQKGGSEKLKDGRGAVGKTALVRTKEWETTA